MPETLPPTIPDRAHELSAALRAAEAAYRDACAARADALAARQAAQRRLFAYLDGEDTEELLADVPPMNGEPTDADEAGEDRAKGPGPAHGGRLPDLQGQGAGVRSDEPGAAEPATDLADRGGEAAGGPGAADGAAPTLSPDYPLQGFLIPAFSQAARIPMLEVLAAAGLFTVADLLKRAGISPPGDARERLTAALPVVSRLPFGARREIVEAVLAAGLGRELEGGATSPAAECSRCSGEYCGLHGTSPCNCDTADRHTDGECPLLPTPKRARKAAKQPSGENAAPPPAEPVRGTCPNCGVHVDDDPDRGPDALCDRCSLLAKPSGENGEATFPTPADRHEAWVCEVRDPAEAASEGERRLEASKGSARYRIAPLPSGGWAVTYGLQYHAGPSGYSGTPWRAYGSRRECLDVFLAAARKFFDPKGRGGNSPSCLKAAKAMSKLLADPFSEPARDLSATAPTLPPARVPANEVPEVPTGTLTARLRIGQRVRLRSDPGRPGVLVSISSRAGDTATHCVTWDRRAGERKAVTSWHDPLELEPVISQQDAPTHSNGVGAEILAAEFAQPGRCRICHCTEDDCSGCIARTGSPCEWADAECSLCSACEPLAKQGLGLLGGLPTKMLERLAKKGYHQVGDVAGKRPEDLAGVKAGDALQVTSEVEKWLRDRLARTAVGTEPVPEELPPEETAILHCAACDMTGRLRTIAGLPDSLDGLPANQLLRVEDAPGHLVAMLGTHHARQLRGHICIGCLATQERELARRRKGRKKEAAAP